MTKSDELCTAPRSGSWNAQESALVRVLHGGGPTDVTVGVEGGVFGGRLFGLPVTMTVFSCAKSSPQLWKRSSSPSKTNELHEDSAVPFQHPTASPSPPTQGATVPRPLLRTLMAAAPESETGFPPARAQSGTCCSQDLLNKHRWMRNTRRGRSDFLRLGGQGSQ